MSIHVFKISLYYDNKWEIKLRISKLAYAMIKNGRKSYVSQLISITEFIFSKLAYAMIKNRK